MHTIRPVIKMFGGKFYSCQWIISHFPKNYEKLTYIEPFIGGGSVFWNKNPSNVEIIADKNPDIINIYYAIQCYGDSILDTLNTIQYTKENFLASFTVRLNSYAAETVIAAAANEIVKRRFSRGGLCKTWAWSNRIRGRMAGEINSWNTYRAEFQTYIDRLQMDDDGLRIELDTEASYFLEEYQDNPDVLFYLDPPYMHNTRTATKCYGKYEMSDDEHVALLKLCLAQKGKVLISGYDSKLYNDMLGDWNKDTKNMPNHSGQNKSKQRRIECLWANY